MSKKYYYQPPEVEPELNLATRYPYKILKFFKHASTEQKILISGGLITVLIVVGSVWLLTAQGAKEQEKLGRPLMGDEVKIQTTQHIQPGASHEPYNSNPPTGGWMYDGTAGAGIHDKEVADELLVHSLEHGAAIVNYKADLAPADVEKLKSVFNSASGKKIMVPRKNLDVPVALTSWGRLLKLQTIDEAKIKEFIDTNNNRAPENAPI